MTYREPKLGEMVHYRNESVNPIHCNVAIVSNCYLPILVVFGKISIELAARQIDSPLRDTWHFVEDCTHGDFQWDSHPRRDVADRPPHRKKKAKP